MMKEGGPSEHGEPFLLFWHRSGNTPQGVEDVHAAAQHGPRSLAGRPVTHGVELDLKWTLTPEGPLLYAHHGPTGRERLSATHVRRRAARGEIHLLVELLAAPRARSLHYLIELKRGHGPAEDAIVELMALLERYGIAGQAWIAASSLELLTMVRRVAPELPRVLFGSPLGRGQLVLHRPTTYIWTSWLRHGMTVRLPVGDVQWLCPLGLPVKSLEAHNRSADAARQRGLGYLPGRVTSWETLEGLSASGFGGAFVYFPPGR